MTSDAVATEQETAREFADRMHRMAGGINAGNPSCSNAKLLEMVKQRDAETRRAAIEWAAKIAGRSNEIHAEAVEAACEELDSYGEIQPVILRTKMRPAIAAFLRSVADDRYPGSRLASRLRELAAELLAEPERRGDR